jgi:hypothetical protein
VAASDETAVQNPRGKFFWVGWIAPETDWSDVFTPEWDRSVLAGPPRIPYLHMVDARSKSWRAKNGVSRDDMDSRVASACRVIADSHSLYPLATNVDQNDFDRYFGFRMRKNRNLAFMGAHPDYICFLVYAYWVLEHAKRQSAEKVDFVVELNGRITDKIKMFHGHLANAARLYGRPDLIPLIGELIPAGKERVPLQAADYFAWHVQRVEANTAEVDEKDRYTRVAKRPGFMQNISVTDLVHLAEDYDSSAESSGTFGGS